MKDVRRVLILSAGDPAGMNFCRSLKLVGRKYHIIGTDTNVFRLGLATADEHYLLPDPDTDAYVPALLRLIEGTRPDFVYASDTNLELALLSQHREDIRVAHLLPPKEAVAVYEDKWLSYCCFKAAGLTVPETILVNSPADLREALRKLGRVWLRATRGSGGRASIATDDLELATAWTRRHQGWGSFTAAEVLTKRMATWIGVWWNGDLVVGQGRERLHWEYSQLSPSGVTGITGAQCTTSDKVITETALAAIRSAGHPAHGIVSVDMTFDAHGRPNPTEIQASRFYTSIQFLAEAGLNLPDIYVELGIRRQVPPLSVRINPLPDGLVWLKAVDCVPVMTTMQALEQTRRSLAETGYAKLER
ncbi:MAG: hypothetical protein R3F14_34250 [Polyangiaceae bacterium]